MEAIQLLEGSDYVFFLRGQGDLGDTHLEPRELFETDDDEGLRGRLRTGLATGRVVIQLVDGSGARLGEAAVEVRSRKLEYTRHTDGSLRTSRTSRTGQESFAAAQQYFSPDDARDARSLYQRFEFLQALLSTEEFDASLHQVLANPYVQWASHTQYRAPGSGVRASSQVARQIAGVRTRGVAGWGAWITPARFAVSTNEATIDNTPNRFVRFALESWRDIASNVHAVLSLGSDTAPVGRGLRGQRHSLTASTLCSGAAHQVVRTLDTSRSMGSPSSKRIQGRLAAYIQAETCETSWPGRGGAAQQARERCCPIRFLGVPSDGRRRPAGTASHGPQR